MNHGLNNKNLHFSNHMGVCVLGGDGAMREQKRRRGRVMKYSAAATKYVASS
jgi:hypothetical protein